MTTFNQNQAGMKIPKTWWLLCAAGILFIAIGTYCFLSPTNAYIKLVKYAGIALLINGFLLVATTFIHTSSETSWKKERKWMHAESIIEFFFGILLIFNPIFSFIVFPFLIGHGILCVGLLKFAASLALKKDIRGWHFIMITGILLSLFGLLIVYYPFARVNDVTLLIGFFSVLTGVLTLFDAYRLRNRRDTLNMLF